MKGTRVVGAGLMALAMVLLVIPASSALAASVLVVKHGEEVVKNGSPADTYVEIYTDAEEDTCAVLSTGTIKENSVKKVFLNETATSEEECGREGESVSGKIDTAELSTNGKAKLTGTIQISKEAGQCVYDFTKFKTTFEGSTFFKKGETSGKLNKELSPGGKACAKKVLAPWHAVSSFTAFGSPFTTEVAKT